MAGLGWEEIVQHFVFMWNWMDLIMILCFMLCVWKLSPIVTLG